MLKLTKTGIGLLTKQYRSVLRKCLLLNLGLFVATTILVTMTPKMGRTDTGIVTEGEIDQYAETYIYKLYYDKYTRASSRDSYLDVETSHTNSGTAGKYFDLEIFLTDLSMGHLFRAGAISSHDIADGTIVNEDIADSAVTDAKIASGITASKITQTSSYRFVTDAEKSTWSGKQDAITKKNKLAASLVSGLASVATSGNASDLTQDATHRLVTDTEKSTWNAKQNALSTAQLNAVNSGITAAKVSTYDGYATTIASKADKATTLSGYGIINAYTKTETDSAISQAISGFVTNDVQSLNYYYTFRVDERDEVTDSASFFQKNFLTLQKVDLQSKNPTHLGAFTKCDEVCPRPSERFSLSLSQEQMFKNDASVDAGTSRHCLRQFGDVVADLLKNTAAKSLRISEFMNEEVCHA